MMDDPFDRDLDRLFAEFHQGCGQGEAGWDALRQFLTGILIMPGLPEWRASRAAARVVEATKAHCLQLLSGTSPLPKADVGKVAWPFILERLRVEGKVEVLDELGGGPPPANPTPQQRPSPLRPVK